MNKRAQADLLDEAAEFIDGWNDAVDRTASRVVAELRTWAADLRIPEGYGLCHVCGIVPLPPNDTGCDHAPPFVIRPIGTP